MFKHNWWLTKNNGNKPIPLIEMATKVLAEAGIEVTEKTVRGYAKELGDPSR